SDGPRRAGAPPSPARPSRAPSPRDGAAPRPPAPHPARPSGHERDGQRETGLLAQRRDATPGLNRVLDTAEVLAEEGGRLVEILDVERDAPEAGGAVVGHSRRSDQLEHHRTEAKEGLFHRALRARAPRLEAGGREGPD